MPRSQQALSLTQVHLISRAIADETRFQILELIYRDGPMIVGSISGQLSVTAATTSHHVRELARADLISVTKDRQYRLLTGRHSTWLAYLSKLSNLAGDAPPSQDSLQIAVAEHTCISGLPC